MLPSKMLLRLFHNLKFIQGAAAQESWNISDQVVALALGHCLTYLEEDGWLFGWVLGRSGFGREWLGKVGMILLRCLLSL